MCCNNPSFEIKIYETIALPLKMYHIHKAHKQDTIAAVATPPGTGGIAIIRVSGPKAIAYSELLFSTPLHNQPSHSAKVRTVYSHTKEERLDQALVLVMRPPRSFTGEETVEIHCHGGHLVARRILESLFHVGVRPANPGEFSFRAFLHGKMDLAQAEAVQLLIGAKSEEALRVAQEHLSGRLSQKILSLQQRATTLTALFEAWVDFPEDDLGFTSFEQAEADMRSLSDDITALLDSYHTGQIVQNGVALCILGAPNVGKSSLMNALLGKDRAIVSSIAGTTRDVVEDDFSFNGLHCRLIDTAGIRETNEPIEEEGIRRSRNAMSRADVVLAILDATQPNSLQMLDPLKEAPKDKTVLVWNKIDLAPNRPLPNHDHPIVVETSATTGEGLHALLQAIERIIWSAGTPRRDEVTITSLRHKESLQRSSEALCRATNGLKEGLSPEFLSLEMRDVLLHLGSIIGTNITEDVLNAIFSKFCIGK